MAINSVRNNIIPIWYTYNKRLYEHIIYIYRYTYIGCEYVGSDKNGLSLVLLAKNVYENVNVLFSVDTSGTKRRTRNRISMSKFRKKMYILTIIFDTRFYQLFLSFSHSLSIYMYIYI